MYIWSKLRHPNVQEFLGVIIFRGELGMVSLWMKEGSLEQYIEANPEAERYQLVCIALADRSQ